MYYSLQVAALATSASANAFITMLGLKLANTSGHRARLRKLVVGGGSVAPQDLQVGVRVRRTDNTGDGTSTAVNVNTIASADANQIASRVSAIGKTYTAEPTAYENGVLAGGSLNTRGTLVLEFSADEAPVWGPNKTLGIEAAPGSASAATLDITVEWEEF